MLDLAAGPGTAMDTIFELKEQGILRGAKRRLRFTEDMEIDSKYPRVSASHVLTDGSNGNRDEKEGEF